VKKIKIGEYLAKLPATAWLSHALSSSFSSVLVRHAKLMACLADNNVSQGSVAKHM